MEAGRRFYDLSEINSISILDVCDALGIPIEKRGRNLWCKVRNEKTASVILHPENNYFYDFGNQEQGNNIAFVQYATGKTIAESIHYLADAFGIEPTGRRNDDINRSLNNWEYAQIGIAGDLASKNVTFPIESASFDELVEMSRAYRIPMNELRKSNPEGYKMIIRDKAVPFVDELRRQYSLDVLNYYEVLSLFDRQVLFFDSEKTIKKFADQTRELERAERILYKAGRQLNLNIPEPKKYNPLRVLTHMLQEGRQKVSLSDQIKGAESRLCEDDTGVKTKEPEPSR